MLFSICHWLRCGLWLDMQIGQDQVVLSCCRAGCMPCTLQSPPGTPGTLGDGVVRVCSQGQANWMRGRKGIGSTEGKHSGWVQESSLRMCPLCFLAWYFFATALAIAMTKTSFLACWCTVRSANFFWLSSSIKSSSKEMWHTAVFLEMMCPVPAATQQGRPSSPVPFSPSSFPTIPEQDQLLPELLPVSWLLSPLQTDHHFFFFFFSTSSTLGNVNLTALHTPWEDPGDFHGYQWDSLSLKL